MRKGYLVFTTHDRDEVDATLVTDKALFDSLRATKNNDEALKTWCDYKVAHDKEMWAKGNRYSARAPGEYQWPFNDVKVLGTFYLCMY